MSDPTHEPTREPTPAQALILWGLLGQQGRAPEKELAPKPKAADRVALVSAGLVAEGKRGRAVVLTVTDAGWRWAGENLRGPLPPAARTLQDWLARIAGHLEATGATLAELVGAAPEEPAPEVKAAPRRRAPGTRARPAAASPGTEAAPSRAPRGRGSKGAAAKPAAAEARPKARPAGAAKPEAKKLRARIEAAYLDLTGGARATAVRLSALRAHLADLDRATVDAGLSRILEHDRTASLSQLSDPKAVTKADRDAAYSPAGDPYHLLRIQ